MDERWAVIPGYSRYIVSTYGRIARHTGIQYEALDYSPDGAGYIRVDLASDLGETKRHYVHRIVASVYIPNPDDKPVVDHINGIRSDNRVSNLRWATYKENAKSRVNQGKRRGRKVVQLSLDGTQSYIWEDMISIRRTLGLLHKRVKAACEQGTILGGYYWRYYDSIPLPGEEWRGLIFGQDTIFVSSLGRVRMPSGAITHGSKTNSGYLAVVIRGTTVVVHRLVCYAFNPVPNCDQLQVNHIDFDKHNNKITNLEWVTQSENIQHSVRAREDVKVHRPVHQFNLDGTFKATFTTAKEAGLAVGVKASCILAVCDGRRKTSKGYKWTYTKEYD